MPNEVHHPLFARFFDRLSRTIEPEVGPHRDEMLAGLTGRVLEIGAGNGINFGHYPSSVEQVVALEPEPFMRAKAEGKADTAPVAVEVVAGVAEELPFPEASFDAAVACLVLCSVGDQLSALRELRRVLRPGGELRFFEHVGSAAPGKRRLQALADGSRVWPRLAGGCHCARATAQAIESVGFRLQRARQIDVGPAWAITNPHLLGSAAR